MVHLIGMRLQAYRGGGVIIKQASPRAKYYTTPKGAHKALLGSLLGGDVILLFDVAFPRAHMPKPEIKVIGIHEGNRVLRNSTHPAPGKTRIATEINQRIVFFSAAKMGCPFLLKGLTSQQMCRFLLNPTPPGEVLYFLDGPQKDRFVNSTLLLGRIIYRDTLLAIAHY